MKEEETVSWKSLKLSSCNYKNLVSFNYICFIRNFQIQLLIIKKKLDRKNGVFNFPLLINQMFISFFLLGIFILGAHKKRPLYCWIWLNVDFC